jgi:hypothetical protein
MGGTKCRPVRWRSHRTVFCLLAYGDSELAGAEAEVRAKDFFGSDLFSKKVTIRRNVRKSLGVFYPFSERFEPIIRVP